MRLRSPTLLALMLSVLSGCGLALQRASVSRSYQARFGCPAATMTRVSDGYHVQGCGRSAEYVCFSEPDGYPSGHQQSAAGVLASVLVGAAFAGVGERCVLASSERAASTPVVASNAPVGVRRVREKDGRALLKTRVLFAGGHLRALAAPRDHPEQVLLIVRSVARMEDAPCASELFHDGVRVPLLQEAREGHYEARLAVPISALSGAQDAVRFAGSVCGIEFDLDPSARATLGLFAAQFQEERARIESELAASHPAALPRSVAPAAMSAELPAPASPASEPEASESARASAASPR